MNSSFSHPSRRSFLTTTLSATALLMLRAQAAEKDLPKPGQTRSFRIGEKDFLLDDKPFQIRCGEIHAARVPHEYWRHRLKMCKAMGLNTVCAYLFWNLHEFTEGEFNWSGRANVAEFCKIAAEEGLWVILRPGPYSCAEWEMGGLPWWLLKHDDIELRSLDPNFIEPARRYLAEVGRELGPLQVTKGGPIIMVQVENEYGFYGDDVKYMEAMHQAVIDAGFDVPTFDCNPTSKLGVGSPEDIFHVVNFGSNVEDGFAALRKLQPQGPKMCGEFYPGWFDTWGNPHHLGNTERYLTDLKKMLELNGSFSIYMAHGGTTFGLWSGCDRPFKPDTSSYDYDAPISEAGWETEKFHLTKELFAKYLLPGEEIPEAPKAYPVTSFDSVTASRVAPVFQNLPEKPAATGKPQSFEQLNLGFGAVLYRTRIPAGEAANLKASHISDFGYVFLDGVRVGALDRRRAQAKIEIPEREKEATLDVLVEPMGRVNFGKEMHDRKGLGAPVTLGGQELNQWEMYTVPLGEKMPENLEFSEANADSLPAFWSLEFSLEEAADTFIDLRNWGKGVIWVNDHCLGRFWNIGPTQTAFAPGVWLRKGVNKVMILDYLGPSEPSLAGLETPILSQLRPELDFGSLREQREARLNEAIYSGEFPASSEVSTVKFDAPVKGRYFAIEALSAHGDSNHAAIAELELLDAQGERLASTTWSVAYVSSEERIAEDGTAENAIDGQIANFWHSEWKNREAAPPHLLILNLGKNTEIYGFRYTPRQSQGGGRIKDYKIYVGKKLVEDL